MGELRLFYCVYVECEMKCVLQLVDKAIKLVLGRKRDQLKFSRCTVVFFSLVRKWMSAFVLSGHFVNVFCLLQLKLRELVKHHKLAADTHT